jgi:hypothetical protein
MDMLIGISNLLRQFESNLDLKWIRVKKYEKSYFYRRQRTRVAPEGMSILKAGQHQDQNNVCSSIAVVRIVIHIYGKYRHEKLPCACCRGKKAETPVRQHQHMG